MDTTHHPAESQGFEIQVSVAEQTLHLLLNGERVKSWPVSTSKFGLGTEPGSYRTPTGRFRIAEKIGDGLPERAILRSRLPTGTLADPGGEEDHVLTRILWLEGLDPENENTRNRYIYIHGTNQEDAIGKPASHGCVRLRNADVVELFDRVPAGTPVQIA